MARNLTAGDRVFVPSSKFEELVSWPTAFYETDVQEINNRKVRVRLPGGDDDKGWIANKLVYENIGVLIFCIGDLETETGLLDPLTKSILQFCRLLVPDDYLRTHKIRSLLELERIWHKDQAAYSHIIVIGHGSDQGLKFANDGWVSTEIMDQTLKIRGAKKKNFISLCCKTGYQSFGGKFSKFTICNSFIGPFHSVHGAVASQFCQTFLTSHLIEGHTVATAFNHARDAIPGSTSFRLWQNGKLKAGPKS